MTGIFKRNRPKKPVDIGVSKLGNSIDAAIKHGEFPRSMTAILRFLEAPKLAGQAVRAALLVYVARAQLRE
jgi:hypothetical protein